MVPRIAAVPTPIGTDSVGVPRNSMASLPSVGARASRVTADTAISTPSPNVTHQIPKSLDGSSSRPPMT